MKRTGKMIKTTAFNTDLHKVKYTSKYPKNSLCHNHYMAIESTVSSMRLSYHVVCIRCGISSATM
jgi:hypothetical protein